MAMCVAVLLGGCTQASPPERPGGSETKVGDDTKATTDAPVAWTEPARTHLLLGKHAPEAKAARYVAVELEGGKVLPVRDVEAVPIENRPDHFASVAGHGGGARWVTQRPASEGVELVELDVADPAHAVAVKLPKAAAAVHVIGASAIVGIGNGLHWVDLGEASPKPELLLERALPGGKAYDVFVRDGGWLFAIDDVVTPIYADTFRVQPDGSLVHEQGFELPSMINGRYHAGVLSAAGKDSGTLFVLGGYGIMSGHGQDLAALPVEAGRPKHDGELVINSTVSTDPPVLEEHVDRGTDKPEKLVAGTEFTPWPDVELAGAGDKCLLLPAGTRGLLGVPAVFTPDTKAQVMFAEPTIDVEVDGDRIFVLTGKQLVELAWALPQPTVKARFDLPDTFDRIVD
jgi:hypothetical protein